VTYRKALQLRPSDWAAYQDLGIFYSRHSRMKEALPLFQQVVELTPDNYEGYTNLGGVYLALGELEKAAKALEKSLELKPTADATTNLGTAYYYERRYADAARYYRKATGMHPNDSLLWGNLGDADRWAGAADDASRDYQQAIALLEKQLTVNQFSADLWSRLAMYNAAMGEHEKALGPLRRALRLNSKDSRVLFRSALVYEEAGQRDRALDSIRAAVAAGYSSEEIGKAPPLEKLRRDPRYLALMQKATPQRTTTETPK
jgi:tetratricopeptide (TPR) repeat protein